MRSIDDGDTIRPLNVADLIAEFRDDVDRLHHADVDEAEFELIYSQYAYVKFGLVLEKVRNRCMWQRCTQKFVDFRQFCQAKVNLNIWQVTNAIKSAQVAVRLAFLGFTELPRNASQALKMAELSIERLGEVWGQVLNTCTGHKITALAIEAQINPDKQSSTETIKLPTHVADALREQAIAAGMTLAQYLEELASPIEEIAADEDEAIEQAECAIELNPEQMAIVDRVEYQWLKPAIDPKKFLDQSIESFDRIMTGLLGNYPKPNQHRAYEH